MNNCPSGEACKARVSGPSLVMAPPPSSSAVDEEDAAVLQPSGLLRADLVRLITQALHELGYPSVARNLEDISGVELLSSEIKKLRAGILAGEWSDVCEIIAHLDLPPKQKRHVQFLVLREV